MTVHEMRMFVDAVRRQADEAFRKQMEEVDERLEAGAKVKQAMYVVRSRPAGGAEAEVKYFFRRSAAVRRTNLG